LSIPSFTTADEALLADGDVALAVDAEEEVVAEDVVPALTEHPASPIVANAPAESPTKFLRVMSFMLSLFPY
jgi:hypothetical protein